MDQLILAHATREQMVAQLASHCVRLDVECFYFGCMERAGHFMHGRDSGRARAVEPVLVKVFGGIDTKLCWNSPRSRLHDYDPGRDETEGRAFVTHRDGWTALAFWDRSVDKRGGCNSAFFVKGTLTFAQIVRVARHHWPKIWSRFTFPVVEVDAQGQEVRHANV